MVLANSATAQKARETMALLKTFCENLIGPHTGKSDRLLDLSTNGIITETTYLNNIKCLKKMSQLDV